MVTLVFFCYSLWYAVSYHIGGGVILSVISSRVVNKGNNKITELRTTLQRESQSSALTEIVWSVAGTTLDRECANKGKHIFLPPVASSPIYVVKSI